MKRAKKTTVKVERKILDRDEAFAARNRKFLAEAGVFCLNMISSPGSGKTTILTMTIGELKGRIRVAVIEGDIQTDLDARKIRQAGVKAVQINTRGGCHLSAEQVDRALKKMSLERLDLLFIENVGNLVCPAVFELGEGGKVAVLSVAEGDDKPAKYPEIFATSAVLLINKIDMIGTGAVDFDIEKVKREVRRLNKKISIFEVSAKTGEGFDGWCEWLAGQVKKIR